MDLQWKAMVNFSCPYWEDLPQEHIFNHEVVSYINEVLRPVVDEGEILTSTMIQNYSKWGLLPKLKGRKYHRGHISILIVISLYKQIIPIQEIKKGIGLQLNRMNLEEGYNIFASCINTSLKKLIHEQMDQQSFYLPTYKLREGAEGLEIVAYAFILKLFARYLIQRDGFLNIGE